MTRLGWLTVAATLAGCAHSEAPPPPRPRPPPHVVVTNRAPPQAPDDCSTLERGDTTVTLLGRRVTLAVRGRWASWSHGHTALPPGYVEPESSVITRVRGGDLRLDAEDTWASAGDDFEARVKKEGGDDVQPLTGTLRGFVTGRGQELARAWLVLPEGNVVKVRAYGPELCRPLALAAMHALNAGDVKVDTSARTLKLGALVELEVPEGFVAQHWGTGELDGVVLMKRVPYGAIAPHLDVNITKHPPNLGTPADRVSPYFGKTVSWRNRYLDGIEARSAILRLPGHEEYAYSTAWSPDATGLVELIAIASKLRLAH